jgi:hypothetical protein
MRGSWLLGVGAATHHGTEAFRAGLAIAGYAAGEATTRRGAASVALLLPLLAVIGWAAVSAD